MFETGSIGLAETQLFFFFFLPNGLIINVDTEKYETN